MFLATPLFAQDTSSFLSGQDVSLMLNLADHKHQSKDPEKMAELAQAQLIQKLFLEPVFMNNELHDSSEDDDDEDLESIRQNNDMYNGIIMKEVAQMMAKKDALKMKKIFLKQIASDQHKK
ncbi:MAG: hypothetical protein EXS67_05535 [Candidatus Margulisbacteria bacterium]|nr:hypothetical protein [Candidatus Margulisiibacteriota bacterium]